jgi:pyridoxamine 5'-phosphate oxidase
MTSTPPKPPAPPLTLDLASERRDYAGPRLLEADTPADPFVLFTAWLGQALAAHILDATAMALATATRDGRPSCRMVLLKGHDPAGLVFYTRYSTQKCVDLAENPQASLLFHWRELDRQVRFEGSVARVSREESHTYFVSRPRLSQLAARAASGLGRIAGAQVLTERFDAEAQYWEGREVELPTDWGGYRVSPARIEFWQGRPNRLHDRLVFEREPSGSWSKYRLAP